MTAAEVNSFAHQEPIRNGNKVDSNPADALHGRISGDRQAAPHQAPAAEFEEAHQAGEKLLRDITSVLGEGLLVQDPGGYPIFMNQEAERPKKSR
ncbi:MAG: hypothetical protein PHX38_14000 [Sulfuricella sp.]|nr:hypothetical protein [Sulfuricella sp.]